MMFRSLSRRGTALRLVIAGVLGAGALLTSTATAHAAANPYTPEGVCGSGYHVIDSRTLTHLNGGSGGKVYLLYNNSSGYNCAVTIKNVSVGVATKTGVKMIIGNTPYEQNGTFKYYAGPIRGRGAGKCVWTNGYTFKAGGYTSYAASIPEGHCGS
ncbi:hypothetical protein ABZV14_24240 [Streptosporangium canum]